MTSPTENVCRRLQVMLDKGPYDHFDPAAVKTAIELLRQPQAGEDLLRLVLPYAGHTRICVDGIHERQPCSCGWLLVASRLSPDKDKT